jgi:DNA-binding beta-propeller fold protein YncE
VKSSLIAAILATTTLAYAGRVAAAPGYSLTKSVPLGAPERWDYAVFDAPTMRVYVAHGDRLTVLDAQSGEVVGQVEGIPGGTHGIAISVRAGVGVTNDGEKGQAILFDLKTLKVVGRIAAGDDADAIARDPATGHVFVMEGDPGTITVIDPVKQTAIATIKAGEKLEYAAADDRGHMFVAGEGSSDLLKIDTRTNTIVARWPTPDCKGPHGLALDKAGQRLFMGCVNNQMMVVDAHSGRVVAELPIGAGSDAIAFDPVRKRVFSPNGRNGTVTVYQQTSPDHYSALAPIQTKVSGRTMTLDPKTGRLFVIAADTDPNPVAGGWPHMRPGTLNALIFDPVP